MNRRTALSIGAAMAAVGVSSRKRASATTIYGYALTDTGSSGTKHWLAPEVAASAFIQCVSAVVRDGSSVPAGASITVTASVSGNQLQLTIPAAARSGRASGALVIASPTDLIRWYATYSGMAPVELDVAIFIS